MLLNTFVFAWSTVTCFVFLTLCLTFIAAILSAKRQGHRGYWWGLYVLGLHSLLAPLYHYLGGWGGGSSRLIAWVYQLITLPLGCEVPLSAQLGRNLTLSHTAGVIIHALAQIGDGCVLTSGVVIGGNGRGGVPRIGNHVFIGANAVIVGDVVIGNQATIGAGTVVVKNIPDYALAVGNPSQIVKTSYIRPYYNSSLVNPT